MPVPSVDGKLDILVNNAYAAVHAIIDGIGKPFYEQVLLRGHVWSYARC
jgi:hypothetical protein